MLIRFHNNHSGQSDHYVSFLLRQATHNPVRYLCTGQNESEPNHGCAEVHKHSSLHVMAQKKKQG